MITRFGVAFFEFNGAMPKPLLPLPLLFTPNYMSGGIKTMAKIGCF